MYEFVLRIKINFKVEGWILDFRDKRVGFFLDRLFVFVCLLGFRGLSGVLGG